MRTTDGKRINIRSISLDTGSFTANATVQSPLIIFKNPGQATPSGAFNYWTNSPSIVIETARPIIPIYFTVALLQVAAVPNNPIYSFATSYLVNINQPNIALPYAVASAKNAGYAGKIAPNCRINSTQILTPVGNGQPKKWVGDAICPSWDKIPFHGDDFVYPNPAFFVPTDTGYWYLNYKGLPTPAGVPPSSQSSGLSTYPTTIGTVYNMTASLMYLSL
jgi:hypothetical protein